MDELGCKHTPTPGYFSAATLHGFIDLFMLDLIVVGKSKKKKKSDVNVANAKSLGHCFYTQFGLYSVKVWSRELT